METLKEIFNNENGCYKDCTNCSLSKKCCSYFDKINAPVLNKNEVLEIKKYYNKDYFYYKEKENIFHLKIIDNKCIFYKNGKCSIYNNRPVDCKLYPYDIIKKGLKYYLILYLVECIDVDKFLKDNSCDDLIEMIIPWIEDFTNEINYTKMKNYKYKIIKEISIL